MMSSQGSNPRQLYLFQLVEIIIQHFLWKQRVCQIMLENKCHYSAEVTLTSLLTIWWNMQMQQHKNSNN